MKLIDLNPNWVSSGGAGITREGVPVPERYGIGLRFNCPCGCGENLYVAFRNPRDGGPDQAEFHPSWLRVGNTFEDLSLTPSILRTSGCKWHGYITSGIVTTV